MRLVHFEVLKLKHFTSNYIIIQENISKRCLYDFSKRRKMNRLNFLEHIRSSEGVIASKVLKNGLPARDWGRYIRDLSFKCRK